VTDERVIDWANLPHDLDAVSIWDSVHDGEIHSFHSDLLARTLTIQFAVPYLVSFHHLPDDVTFAFSLGGVQSVRVIRLAVWPGKFELPSGLPWQEEETLRGEYFAKCRLQSESWDKFEHDVTSDGDAEFSTGELALDESGAVAVRLGILMGGGHWYEVFVRAESLTVTRSDRQPLSLQQFMQFGNAYWKAFAARQNTPQK
jgi:hypothetical protein